MAKLIQQSTSSDPLFFFLVLTSDHVSPATGLSPTVTISKNGAAFGSPSGAVTEIASGWYQVAGNATDTNTLGDILLHASVATADNCDLVAAQVVAFNPRNSSLGISFPSNFGSMLINGSGRVSILDNLQQNTALNGFMFTMLNSTTGLPQSGLSVTAQRSLAGASLGACANSPTEVANGIYSINLAAADLNAASVMFRFTAAGALDTDVEVITTP